MNFDDDFSTEPQVNNNSSTEMNLDDVLLHLDSERISDYGYEPVMKKATDSAAESEQLREAKNLGNTDAAVDEEGDTSSRDCNEKASECSDSEDDVKMDYKDHQDAQVENGNDETIPMRNSSSAACYPDGEFDVGHESKPIAENTYNFEDKEVEHGLKQELHSHEPESDLLEHVNEDGARYEIEQESHSREQKSVPSEHVEVYEAEHSIEHEPNSHEQESIPSQQVEDDEAEYETEQEPQLGEQESVPEEHIDDKEAEYEIEQETHLGEQESIPEEHIDDKEAEYEIEQETHLGEQESVPEEHIDDKETEYEIEQETHSGEQESVPLEDVEGKEEENEVIEQHSVPLQNIIEEELKENGFNHVDSSLEKSLTCSSCREDVYPGEEITAMDQLFHKKCFRCTECGCTLTAETNYVEEGKPYCESHFDKLLKPNDAPIDSDVVKHSYTRADDEELPAPQFTKTMISKYEEACDASPAPTTTPQHVGKLKAISDNEIVPPTGSAKRLVDQWSSITQTPAESSVKQSAATDETHYAPNTAKVLAAKFSAGLFEPSESNDKSSKLLRNGDQVETAGVGSQGDELPSKGQARGLIAKFSAMHA